MSKDPLLETVEVETAAGVARSSVPLGLRCGVLLLFLSSLALPLLATASGIRDGALINGDEAVAALLPLQFSRGEPNLLFPGNAYQGILETPVYAFFLAVGARSEWPLRLFHQMIWTSAVAIWAVAGVEPRRRSGRVGVAERWWALLIASGFLLLTSVTGWPVWYQIYPGYQLGALLAALGVLVSLRAVRLRGWVAAGALAGAAVYAQPMHLAGVVGVGVAALCLSGSVGRWRRSIAAGVGMVIGIAPLALWNLLNGFASLDVSAVPNQHPEWRYPERWSNTLRLTGRILFGDNATRLPSSAAILRPAVAVVLLALGWLGIVALVRSGRRGWPLLACAATGLIALPVLRSFSLDVDYRYGVAWWPALVVVIAAGGATLAAVSSARWRSGLLLLVVTVGALNLIVVGIGARNVIADRNGTARAEDLTHDLAGDLRLCGVDGMVGDYWSVYPVSWAEGGGMQALILPGMDRLGSLHQDWRSVRRVAVLPATTAAEPIATARTVGPAVGRVDARWIAAVHPESGTPVVLEVNDIPFPKGCIGANGLQLVQ